MIEDRRRKRNKRGGGREREREREKKKKKEEEFSSFQSLDQMGHRGGHEGRFSRCSLAVFSAGGPCKQIWHGKGCPLSDVVHPECPLPATVPWSLEGRFWRGCRGV